MCKWFWPEIAIFSILNLLNFPFLWALSSRFIFRPEIIPFFVCVLSAGIYIKICSQFQINCFGIYKKKKSYIFKN